MLHKYVTGHITAFYKWLLLYCQENTVEFSRNCDPWMGKFSSVCIHDTKLMEKYRPATLCGWAPKQLPRQLHGPADCYIYGSSVGTYMGRYMVDLWTGTYKGTDMGGTYMGTHMAGRCMGMGLTLLAPCDIRYTGMYDKAKALKHAT